MGRRNPVPAQYIIKVVHAHREVDVRKVRNPSKPVFEPCFWTFLTISTRFPLSTIDPCRFFDLALLLCSRRLMLYFICSLDLQLTSRNSQVRRSSDGAFDAPKEVRVVTGITDPESIFQFARGEPITSVQVSMPGYGEPSPVATQKNRA